MKRILYLGLEEPRQQNGITWIHFPVIKTIARAFSETELQATFSKLVHSTHLIITSKMAARYFMAACNHFSIDLIHIHAIPCFSVGSSTTRILKTLGFKNIMTAENECQEGVMQLILSAKSKHMNLFYPHSQLSRRDLVDFLTQQSIAYTACVLYDTETSLPQKTIDWNTIDAVYFSSPSTVDAFLNFLPQTVGKELMYQGAETKKRLYEQLAKATSWK